MRAILHVAPFLLACVACMGQPRQLFNGRNLDGWAFLGRNVNQLKNGTPGFVVENGGRMPVWHRR